MANPTCTKATLTSPCYTVPGAINERQAKTLMLYAMALELAANGGTDYIGRMALMLSDAATLACGMRQPDRDAARITLAFNRASAAGASVPTGVNSQVAKSLCLVSANEQQLDEALLLLECKLGVHKSYPQ